MLDKIISLPKFSETFETFFLERNIFRRTKLFLKSFSANEIFFCGLKSFSSDEKYFCGLKIYFSFSKVVPRGFGGTKVAPKTAWNHTTGVASAFTSAEALFNRGCHQTHIIFLQLYICFACPVRNPW